MKDTYLVVDEQVLSDRLDNIDRAMSRVTLYQMITSLSVLLSIFAWWLK